MASINEYAILWQDCQKMLFLFKQLKDFKSLRNRCIVLLKKQAKGNFMHEKRAKMRAKNLRLHFCSFYDRIKVICSDMRENKYLEFKKQMTDTFLKTVSAYANYGTGIILLGIRDDGKELGVKDPKNFCSAIEKQARKYQY